MVAAVVRTEDLPAVDRFAPAGGRDQRLLAGVQAFIDAHLRDEQLTPRVVAAANHISVRYLHQIFQRQGNSVAAWIRTRRLDRCRCDLEDPALDGRPVYAVGARWGLAPASDFNRSFRAAYGVPPGEWRRAAQRGRSCTE
jgi:AraC-like DNA-binding protein